MVRYLLLILIIGTSCENEKKERVPVAENIPEVRTDIPVYNFETLAPFLYTETDKTYIINFWAMWCVPCVEELPYIQQYADKNPNVEVLLVSLDFPKDIETKLKPFLKEKNISIPVILLDDPDANSWIDKIDPNWSGTIPFTIIFNHEKRVFITHPFASLEDLEKTIAETI